MASTAAPSSMTLSDPEARARLELQYQVQEARTRYQSLKKGQVDPKVRDGIEQTTAAGQADERVKAS